MDRDAGKRSEKMKRRQVLAGLFAAAGGQFCAANAAVAASFAEQIVSQLRAQGFGDILVETTWLGRTRILAERRDLRREIILNPNTGEILRDLWSSKSGGTVQIGRIGDDDEGNSGHGGGSDDDGGDDDGNDDGGRDDND